MRKTLLALLAAVPAAILAGQVQADDPPGPGPRGGPGMFFQRLDKNNDGKVTADEVPESAPQFLKDMLKKADKNDDKTITADELREAAPQLRPDSPNAHFRGPRPEGRPEAGPPSRGPAGPPSAHRGPRPEGRSEGGPRAGSPQRPTMEPGAVFVRLDRDKDGKLSPDEFAAGMKAMHPRMGRPGHPATGRPAGRGSRPKAKSSRLPLGRSAAMHRSHGRQPMPFGRCHRGGMQRPPMAFHGGFRGMPPRAMGSRPPLRGLGGPCAPWQGRCQGVQRSARGPHGWSPAMGHGAMMARHLKGADKNDDGKISKSEAPERLKQNFDRVDADKDGQLDRAEMAKAAMAARKQFAAGAIDKRREAFAKRTEAVRKARAGAKRHQSKKPEAKKRVEKKAEAKKPAEKKPEAKKPAEKKAEAKKAEAKKAEAKKAEAKKAEAKKPIEKKAVEKKAAEKKPEAKKP